MQVMARSSHAACHSFFTLRRATWVCALRSTALVFTRACRTQSKLGGMPRLERSGLPFSVARREASWMDTLAVLRVVTELFSSTDILMFSVLCAIRGSIGGRAVDVCELIVRQNAARSGCIISPSLAILARRFDAHGRGRPRLHFALDTPESRN